MGIWEYRTYNVASTQEPEQVQGIRATASLFTVLGVPPALGRIFTEEEEAPGHRVVVISDGVWRTHFGGQRVGDRIVDATQRRAVRGDRRHAEGDSSSRGATTACGCRLRWTEQDRAARLAFVLGRGADEAGGDVRAGARRDRAGRPLAAAEATRRTATRARRSRGWPDQGLGTLRTMLTALMGAVALVLVIACVNVANLQLGRALARRREFAMRMALGAGIGRLARQLFAESLVLAVAGGIGGGGARLDRDAGRGSRADARVPRASLSRRGADRDRRARAAVRRGGGARLRGDCLASRRSSACAHRNPQAPAARRRSRLDVGGQRRAAIARRRGSRARDRRPLRRRPAGEEPGRTAAGQPGLDPREVLTLQVSLPQADTYGPPVRESFCADLSRGAEGLPGHSQRSARSVICRSAAPMPAAP